MQVSTARREVAEVLPALAVERHHLTVQDRLFHWQFFPDPVAEFRELLKDVPPLGLEMTTLPRDVQQAAVAVVLGLEEPSGVIERVRPRSEQDRLNGGEGPADSWAHAGSWAA
jgi:hypothetical protein